MYVCIDIYIYIVMFYDVLSVACLDGNGGGVSV